MDEVSSEFVAQAALIATSGRWDAVNKRIEQWAARPMAPDDRWYGQLFSGLCEHVFSEYWLLKQAYADAGPRDVSLLAWRARNLLELSVWSVYCGKSTANARRLYEDAGREAFRAKPGTTPKEPHQTIRAHAAPPLTTPDKPLIP